MRTRDYHLGELAIAQSPDDPRHAMPTIRPEHHRILDVGCGAGQTLIASPLDRDALAVGIDVDFEALALGTELTEAVHFACSVAEALPLADASFDLVFSRVTLPLTYLPAAVAEIGRVLRPGGDVWLLLHSLDRTVRLLADNVAHLQLKRAAYRSYVLANGLLFHLAHRMVPFPTDGHYESFQTKAAIRRELDRAGFEAINFPPGRHFVVTATKRLL